MCVCCVVPPVIKRITHPSLSSSLPLFLSPPPQVVMEAACFAIQPMCWNGSAGGFNGTILQKIMSIDDAVPAANVPIVRNAATGVVGSCR